MEYPATAAGLKGRLVMHTTILAGLPLLFAPAKVAVGVE